MTDGTDGASQAKSGEGFARSAGIGALVLFVLAVWWADSRSHHSQGFDWRRAQREYFAREGLDERPRVRHRAIVTDEKGTTADEACETCHVGAEKTHPGKLLAAHPKNVGCTHCHGGTPGELSMAAHAKKDLRGQACVQCHGLQVEPREDALRSEAQKSMAQVLAGQRVYESRQCGECHEQSAAGAPPSVDDGHPPMPLTDLDVRRRPEQVLAFLLHPAGVSPHGTMPAFFEGRRDDALAITAYLLSPALRKDPSLREDADHGANITGASADEGGRLYASLGCAACHAAGDAGGTGEEVLGPSLADIGRRSTEDYLATYLRDPARVHPRTRMPSFRLDAREAASLAKHLGTMVAKEPLPLSPDEARSVAARDLATAKVACSTGETAPRADCGKRLYDTLECAACHDASGPAGDGAPRTLTPAFHQQGSRLTYALPEPDRAAVIAYMEAQRLPIAPPGLRAAAPPRRVEAARGRRIVEDLGCRACHGTAGKQAPITMVLPDKLRSHLPPPLEGEGSRTRPEWLFAFLRRPASLGVRPVFHPEWVYGRVPPLDALAPRMPTFSLTEAETTAVVRSMTAAGDVYPFTDPRPHERTPEERLAAFVLLNRGDEKSRCTSCHFTADLPVDRMKADPASVAPGFNGLVLRRRPEWVMSFIPTHDASHHAEGKPTPTWTDKDASLVTDVLFSLDDRGKLPRPGEETRAPLP